MWGGGAQGMALLESSGSCRSASFDASSSSRSGYSAGALTTVGRDMSLSHWNIGKSTQVSSGNASYHCPDTSFRSSVSPNTKEEHASHDICTLHTPEGPCEVFLCTRVFSSACSSLVHSTSNRCAFSFGIQTGGFPFASFDSDHLPILQGFAIWIIHCAASHSESCSPVLIAYIRLFIAEYCASAPCSSITVSSSGTSGAPGNSHIVWIYES